MSGSECCLEAFAAWVVEREEQVVGQWGMCFLSPLARWLSELSGGVMGVEGTCYGRACAEFGEWVPLPRWAVVLNRHAERWFAHEVTGAQAFLALAEIEHVVSGSSGV